MRYDRCGLWLCSDVLCILIYDFRCIDFVEGEGGSRAIRHELDYMCFYIGPMGPMGPGPRAQLGQWTQWVPRLTVNLRDFQMLLLSLKNTYVIT